MDLIGGFVAPEDLVVAADGFGGEHQPIGVGIAGAGPPGRGDVEGGSALLHDSLAVVAAEERGVALGFDRGEGSADDGIAIEINLEAGFDAPGFGAGAVDQG